MLVAETPLILGIFAFPSSPLVNVFLVFGKGIGVCTISVCGKCISVFFVFVEKTTVTCISVCLSATRISPEKWLTRFYHIKTGRYTGALKKNCKVRYRVCVLPLKLADIYICRNTMVQIS